MKPTEEQIKKFWEWCGFKGKLSTSENPYYWFAPNAELPYGNRLPRIDLNNLFEWAVPKLTKKGYHVETRTYSGEAKGIEGKCSWVAIQKDLEEPIWFTSANLEDALFWAIYKVMEAADIRQ